MYIIITFALTHERTTVRAKTQTKKRVSCSLLFFAIFFLIACREKKELECSSMIHGERRRRRWQ